MSDEQKLTKELPDQVEIESLLNKSLEHSCTCGDDENSCRHCGYWIQAMDGVERLHRAALTPARDERLEELCALIKQGGTFEECKAQVISATNTLKIADEGLEMLEAIIDADDANSGAEPSISVLYRAIDEARKWVAQRALSRPLAQRKEGDSICRACKGAGTIKGMTYGLGPDDYETDVECPTCKGTGELAAPASPEQQRKEEEHE